MGPQNFIREYSAEIDADGFVVQMPHGAAVIRAQAAGGRLILLAEADAFAPEPFEQRRYFGYMEGELFHPSGKFGGGHEYVLTTTMPPEHEQVLHIFRDLSTEPANPGL